MWARGKKNSTIFETYNLFVGVKLDYEIWHSSIWER
jgi:hypothetical protein